MFMKSKNYIEKGTKWTKKSKQINEYYSMGERNFHINNVLDMKVLFGLFHCIYTFATFTYSRRITSKNNEYINIKEIEDK